VSVDGWDLLAMEGPRQVKPDASNLSTSRGPSAGAAIPGRTAETRQNTQGSHDGNEAVPKPHLEPPGSPAGTSRISRDLTRDPMSRFRTISHARSQRTTSASCAGRAWAAGNLARLGLRPRLVWTTDEVMNSGVRLIGCVLALAATGGCGPSPTTPAALAGEGASAPTQITCAGTHQVIADLDYFGHESGFETPQSATRDWIELHRHDATRDFVVARVTRRGATAFLLRDDGTAHTRLTLDRSENGWFVGGYQACARSDPLR